MKLTTRAKALVLQTILASSVAIAYGQPPPQEPEVPSTEPEVRRASEPEAPSDTPSFARPPYVEGLWPSPKLTEFMLVRWADRTCDLYEMDEAQRAKAREAVVKRWGRYFNENRSAIAPLLNEFLEMRMDLEPPAKERVQDWADRAGPTFESFRKQVDQGADEFRELLTPEQEAKFEVQALQLEIGIDIAGKRLEEWQAGKIKIEDIWEPLGTEGRRSRAELRQRRAEEVKEATERATAAAETDQIAIELSAWDKYVETFIQVYALDEGQRAAVRSCLSELKQRAFAHRDRRQADIIELEQRIKKYSGADAERAELEKQLTELYGPIDEMFKELKRRIEQVPTEAQRAAVSKTPGE